MEKLHTFYEALKSSFKLFKRHDTATLGAALSYYTVFSLAPLLIIAIAVAGSLLGPDAVEGEIGRQLQGFLGARSAQLLQDIIKAAYKPGQNMLVTIIAVVLLLIGATSVFNQLRNSLDTIWDVKDRARKPIARFFVTRLFSFAMIGCLIFLLLVSLVIHAALEAFTNYLDRRLPQISVDALKIFDISLAFIFTVILFMMVYKFMSDARLRWRSVWWGSLFTAMLFTLGKYLLGWYLGRSNIADTYGAAGSVVVILLWVFYSSQILFFGAEFTRALAKEKGVSLDPKNIKSDRTIALEEAVKHKA